MSKNSPDQPAKKPRKSRRKAPGDRQREPTSGSFKPGDPRINYKGRPPDLVGFRQLMREMGEEKALNYLLDCMELGVQQDSETGERRRILPSGLGLQAATEWLHMCRGKPRQQIAVTGMDDGPVRVADGPDLSKLTVAQLKQWRELVRAAQPDQVTQ